MDLKIKQGQNESGLKDLFKVIYSFFYPKMTVLLRCSGYADLLCVCPQSFSIIAPLVDFFSFFFQGELSISLSPACHRFPIFAALYFAFEFLRCGHSWMAFKLENSTTREIRLPLKCCSPKRQKSSSCPHVDHLGIEKARWI